MGSRIVMQISVLDSVVFSIPPDDKVATKGKLVNTTVVDHCGMNDSAVRRDAIPYVNCGAVSSYAFSCFGQNFQLQCCCHLQHLTTVIVCNT